MAPDLAAARTAFHARQELAVQRITIKARLDGLLPQGLDALETELENLDQAISSHAAKHEALGTDAPPKSRDEIEADRCSHRQQLAALGKKFQAAHEVQNQTQIALGKLDEQLRYRQREFDQLKVKLPEEDEARAAQLDRLELALKRQHDDLSDALQLAQSFRDQAPESQQQVKLESELVQARRAHASHQQAVQQLQQDIAALSATLERGGAVNNPSDLAELETRFERLTQRVKKISRRYRCHAPAAIAAQPGDDRNP